MANEFKDHPQLTLKAKMLMGVAEKLPQIGKEMEVAYDEDEDIGSGGYSPMLCPSCTRFLDHVSFWRQLDDWTIVHKLKCGHCDMEVTMLIRCEPLPYKTQEGLPVRGGDDPGGGFLTHPH
jgi:hypothetical protein